MLDNTIVIFTADHGEMDGAHGLKGKGGFMYEQNIHVPLVIYHPEYKDKGGQKVDSVTSHIDLAPTLVNMTHISADRKAALTAGLPGGDLMELIRNPSGSIREGALFCAELISTTMAKAHTDSAGNITYYTFDTGIRGFCRAIITERYKFARYFSIKFNTPTTLEELYANNDVELYDLQNDPDEMNNLAADPEGNKVLIMGMSAKLNELIAKEIGEDDGSEAIREIEDYEASLSSRSSGGCNAGMYPLAAGGVVLLFALLAGLRRRK
jgi:arylsulfatase